MERLQVHRLIRDGSQRQQRPTSSSCPGDQQAFAHSECGIQVFKAVGSKLRKTSRRSEDVRVLSSHVTPFRLFSHSLLDDVLRFVQKESTLR